MITLKEQLEELNKIDLDRIAEPKRSQLILYKDNVERALREIEMTEQDFVHVSWEDLLETEENGIEGLEWFEDADGESFINGEGGRWRTKLDPEADYEGW